jgi:cytochrome b6-f complex iron-sulfur subunit
VPSPTQSDVQSEESDGQLPSRRRVLAVGAVVSAAGVAALAGCSSSSSPAASAASTPAASGPAASTPAASTAPSAAAPAGLAKLSDVPVGGSASATSNGPDGKAAVVAQPTAGNVVAFSAICTHMGCTVAPAGNQYHCPCHGSVYDAFTGKVISGPAPAALTSIPVKVDSGEIVVSS